MISAFGQKHAKAHAQSSTGAVMEVNIEPA